MRTRAFPTLLLCGYVSGATTPVARPSHSTLKRASSSNATALRSLVGRAPCITPPPPSSLDRHQSSSTDPFYATEPVMPGRGGCRKEKNPPSPFASSMNRSSGTLAAECAPMHSSATPNAWKMMLPAGRHEKHRQQTRAAHAEELLPLGDRPFANLERLRAHEVHVRPRGADHGEDDERRRVVQDERGEHRGGEEDVVDLEVVHVLGHAAGRLGEGRRPLVRGPVQDLAHGLPLRWVGGGRMRGWTFASAALVAATMGKFGCLMVHTANG